MCYFRCLRVMLVMDGSAQKRVATNININIKIQMHEYRHRSLPLPHATVDGITQHTIYCANYVTRCQRCLGVSLHNSSYTFPQPPYLCRVVAFHPFTRAAVVVRKVIDKQRIRAWGLGCGSSFRLLAAFHYDCTASNTLPRICPSSLLGCTVHHMQVEAPFSTKNSVPPVFNNCGIYGVLCAQNRLVRQTNAIMAQNTRRLAFVSWCQGCEDVAEALHWRVFNWPGQLTGLGNKRDHESDERWSGDWKSAMRYLQECDEASHGTTYLGPRVSAVMFDMLHKVQMASAKGISNV